MKLSTLKKHLQDLDQIAFELPNGQLVPRHFHVTEVGKINKQFVDCGGKMRVENKVSLQLWEADDYDHRLHPDKLLKIIEITDQAINLDDNEVEVEYQGETLGKYNLELKEDRFLMVPIQTACLAQEQCGIPLATIDQSNTASGCTPGGGCC